jgi:hypothetical protein
MAWKRSVTSCGGTGVAVAVGVEVFVAVEVAVDVGAEVDVGVAVGVFAANVGVSVGRALFPSSSPLQPKTPIDRAESNATVIPAFLVIVFVLPFLVPFLRVESSLSRGAK